MLGALSLPVVIGLSQSWMLDGRCCRSDLRFVVPEASSFHTVLVLEAI